MVTGTTSPIIVSGLTNGTPYTFTVFATNQLGSSEQSAASSLVIPAGVPTAPTSLVASSVGNTDVTITFTAPTSNSGSAITNYKYSANGGTSYTAFSPTDTASPVTISDLSPNTAYSIRLRAVNAVGDGTESTTLSVTTTGSIPSVPAIQFALPDDEAVWVYFVAGATGTPTNYQYSTDGTTYTDASPATTANPIRIPGLTNGTAYSITLKAVNGAGESDASNTVSGTPVAPSTPSALLYFDPSNPSSYSGSGNTITSIGSHGALSGTFPGSVTYNAGVKGGVLDFNGVNGTMIAFPIFDFGNTFSVTAWIYPREEFSINALITNAGANTATNGFKCQWNGWNSENKVMQFQAGNGTDGGDNTTLVNTITYAAWQHVAYVFDKVNRRVLFFLNGEPATMLSPISFVNPNDKPVADINTNAAFYIGGYAGGFYTMDAQLGYLKTFNSFLDATQVRADYAASQTRFA